MSPKLLVCRPANIWLQILRCFYWMNGYFFSFIILILCFPCFFFLLNMSILVIFMEKILSLLTMFSLSQVKFVNTNGLLNFNVDLKKCEEFAASRPVTGFAVGTLEMSFEELRQVS